MAGGIGAKLSVGVAMEQYKDTYRKSDIHNRGPESEKNKTMLPVASGGTQFVLGQQTL